MKEIDLPYNYISADDIDGVISKDDLLTHEKHIEAAIRRRKTLEERIKQLEDESSKEFGETAIIELKPCCGKCGAFIDGKVERTHYYKLYNLGDGMIHRAILAGPIKPKFCPSCGARFTHVCNGANDVIEHFEDIGDKMIWAGKVT